MTMVGNMNEIYQFILSGVSRNLVIRIVYLGDASNVGGIQKLM